MRRFGKLSAGLFAAMFMMNGATAWAGELADTVYHGGKIYTMTETKQEAAALQPKLAEVVAVKDGKIVFVGSKHDAKLKSYFITSKVDKYVDLKGKTMYPGFIDGHSHFPNQGTDDLYKVNLNSPLYDGPVTDMASLISELKKRADNYKAQGLENVLIEGYNYDDTKLAEGVHPTAADLDKASPDFPILIKHISGHVAVANTKAMELCGVFKFVEEYEEKYAAMPEGSEKDKLAASYAGVRLDENGKPTGVLMETASMGLITPTVTDDKGKVIHTNYTTVSKDAQAEVARATQVYAAAGVTTADNGGSMMFGDMLTWQNAVANGNLGVRLVAHPFGYFYYPGWGEFGYQNRRALGWKDSDGSGEFKDGAGTPGLGADITKQLIYNEYPGYGIVPINSAQVAMDLPDNRIFMGAWKFIFDGSPQAYTAWMKAPGNYDLGSHTVADEDKTNFDAYEGFNGLPGTMNMSAETLAYYIDLYHKQGFATETHTNGSGAAEAWLTAVEEAVMAAGSSVTDTRHTSIHGQTLERQHIERMTGNYANLAATKDMYTDLMGAGGKPVSELGNLPELMKAQNIFCSFFNNHVYFYGDRHHDIFFGPGRAMNISPVGWAEAYGLPYSFHNDTDVTPISPLRSITTAVTRLTAEGKLLSKDGEKNLDATVEYNALKDDDNSKTKFWAYDHRINALQALHAVTTGPAWQNNIDDRVGSIEVGKMADFTIMDKDILKQAEDDPTKIATMRVATTIVSDKVIHGALPDAEEFASAPAPGFEQLVGLRPNITDTEIYSKEDILNKGGFAALPEGEALLGAIGVEANIQRSFVEQGTATWKNVEEADFGANITFSFKILGNGDTISNLKLYKLRANENLEYAYRGEAFDLSAPEASGTWWVADSVDPLVALPATATLELDHTYIINFVIADGSAYDEDGAANGKIKDPVAVTSTTGKLPDNGAAVTAASGEYTGGTVVSGGGSSGGCTVGTNSAYELFALLLASLGVMAGRIFRRRNA